MYQALDCRFIFWAIAANSLLPEAPFCFTYSKVRTCWRPNTLSSMYNIHLTFLNASLESALHNVASGQTNVIWDKSKGKHCSIAAAVLAQSVERLTAEREVAGEIPGIWPTLKVLKWLTNESTAIALQMARPSRGSDDRVKWRSPISTTVLNTLIYTQIKGNFFCSHLDICSLVFHSDCEIKTTF